MMHIQSKEDKNIFESKANHDLNQFWNDIANEFDWHSKWEKVNTGDFEKVDFKWFEGGKLNITLNCIDRHLAEKKDDLAFIWEGNDITDQKREFTYQQLHEEVCKTANVLKELGAKKGDRICLYMPMVPELAFAVLACARIGAIHSVVFGGFSAKALAERIEDAQCKILLTADSVKRGAKEIPLKAIADEAIARSSSIKSTLVLKRTGVKINWNEELDNDWDTLLDKASIYCEAEIMDAEDPLFILYTSGSTGKPKGLVHTCGGYMVYTGYSFKNVFQYQPGDVYWCTADIGWITGHSYIVYGPLLNGATSLLFEGVPTWPDAGRFWDVVQKYKVNIFYTAPTAIRALQTYGTEIIEDYDLSSLKTLGSVGEPINEEAWQWYNKYIGKNKCPIVDTWWQTETGGILISPLAGITNTIPTYATQPLPGIFPDLVDTNGNLISQPEAEGNLCIVHSWPSQARTIYGDHKRFIETYFSAYPGKYFTGDGAKRDAKGNYRITGRVDDVINVSGHRIGTAEIENAIDEVEEVCETAVVGFPHPIKGQGIYAFIVCYENVINDQALRDKIQMEIIKEIGSISKCDKIQFVTGLPKTRSGKIMRRILRKLAEGNSDQLGDTSTLLDPSIVEKIKNGVV